MLEFVGYVGTALVALSFISQSMVRLRALNVGGAILITIYAISAQAYPIALLDGFIAVVNGYQLIVLYRQARRSDVEELF
jgi:hypothetical protein